MIYRPQPTDTDRYGTAQSHRSTAAVAAAAAELTVIGNWWNVSCILAQRDAHHYIGAAHWQEMPYHEL